FTQIESTPFSRKQNPIQKQGNTPSKTTLLTSPTEFQFQNSQKPETEQITSNWSQPSNSTTEPTFFNSTTVKLNPIHTLNNKENTNHPRQKPFSSPQSNSQHG
ncbi:hypothetical protein KC19_8G112100, partial [Ceratodon purpureus]